jgi:hypothetical protein
MKKIFGLVALLLTGAFAATSALYLHHERSTQATIEADCQNREICLDKTNLAPVGRFNDGTLWHGVTQEKPNVNLTGSLTVTGATVLSNNLTLSLIPTGRIPYTTTAGLVTSGTGLTYDGTAFSVTGTAAISGVTTFTAAPVFSSATASQAMFTNGSKALVSNAITGSGNVVMSASPTLTGTIAAASQTLSGTLGVTGNLTLAGRSNFNGATDVIPYFINIKNGSIAASRSGGAGGLIESFGVGDPSASNTERMRIYHDGTSAYLESIATGTGTYRPLLINNGGATAITVATNQAVSLSSTLGVTGVTTATGGVTFGNASPTNLNAYQEGTFTATITGCTTSPTGTASYVLIGKSVTLILPAITATSNATTFTYTGLPAGIQPTTTQNIAIKEVSNNVIAYDDGTVQVGASGTITFRKSASASGWTNSGTKGLAIATTISYSLQ